MTSYILVMLLYKYAVYGGSAPISTAEFSSLAACQSAAEIIKKEMEGSSFKFYWVCVPK